MSGAKDYYDSLIGSGYSEDVSLDHTLKYFPGFVKPVSSTDQTTVLSVDSEEERSHFIPISTNELFSSLLESNLVPRDKQEAYRNIICMLEAIWHHSAHEQLRSLKSQYQALDPNQSSFSYSGKDVESFISVLDEVLKDGNWMPISQEEIDEALAGEDVLPISLDVRFEEFRTMRLYKLGTQIKDVTSKSLFGLRKVTKSAQIFENIITVLEFQDEKWFADDKKRLRNKIETEIGGLHIRLFRDVPHLDSEVIFPNTSPSMRTFDKIKIAAPLVGGFVSLALKYLPLLFGSQAADTSLSVLGGVLAGLGTYVLKTYTSYQKTRENFRKIVARDMYFKGMANDSPVLTYIVDLAESQEVKEAVLAYVFLSSNPNGLSEDQLDEQVEDWLKQTFCVRVDFEVDDALSKLSDMMLLRSDNGHYTVVDPHVALEILDDYWDGLYDY